MTVGEPGAPSPVTVDGTRPPSVASDGAQPPFVTPDGAERRSGAQSVAVPAEWRGRDWTPARGPG